MVLYLEPDFYSIINLAFITFILPLFTVGIYELFFSKTGLSKASLITGCVCLFATIGTYIAVSSSVVNVEAEEISLEQHFYSRSILMKDIDNIGFYLEMERSFMPDFKINGIAFGNIQIGTFSNSSGKSFFMNYGTPVCVINTEPQQLVFTCTREVHDKIKESVK